MLTTPRLERFKSFREAELLLGPLTLLVGANASGKSNIRDAFRFLHGIGRGYTIPEILGEKWGEGGVLQWHGIRGGTREATHLKAETFKLAVSLSVAKDDAEGSSETRRATYAIEVDPGSGDRVPRVVTEYLACMSRKRSCSMHRQVRQTIPRCSEFGNAPRSLGSRIRSLFLSIPAINPYWSNS